jgi:ribosome-associated protein
MDITKLQRTVVDALEDVKAQDIRVFSTTHMTSLFDRVIIASATSNRQTRALASSVAETLCNLLFALTTISKKYGVANLSE